MSYRDDHDAALARIDALEVELERLQRETPPAAPPPPARRPSRTLTLVAGVAGTLAAFALIGVFVPEAPHPAPAQPMPAQIALDPGDRAALRLCLDMIETKHVTGLDEYSTDPHGTARPVAPIVAVGTACRDELARLAQNSSLDDAQREAVTAWQADEDELAGAISRLVVYYESDPYKLDGYQTAPQVWRELDLARTERDQLIAKLDARLRPLLR